MFSSKRWVPPADAAGITSGVGFSLSGYLFTHPEVNDYLTIIQGLPKEQLRAKIQEYLAANPHVRDDIRAIRQPTIDFRSRCDISTMPPGLPMPAQS
mgnify:CR=1 FL=1